MNLFKQGDKDVPLQLLEKAERMVENLKQAWYFRHKELGDMLANISAVKAITTTYNNLGVFYKRYEMSQLNFMKCRKR